MKISNCSQQRSTRRATSLAKLSFFLVIGLVHVNSIALNEQEGEKLGLEVLIDSLTKSWAIEYSPNNTLFVTHRNGSFSEYALDGTLINTTNLDLDDLYVAGQGGLMDVEFHPEYKSNGWIYFSYSFGNEKANGLKVIRAKFEVNETRTKLTEKQDIFVQTDLRDTASHYGARLAFLADSTLLITTGEGFDYREQAQVLESELGKILRLTDEGEVPTNNPTFTESLGFSSKVYSLGHRNPQGLVVLPNGDIWANEHGPDGGDEVNKIIKSQNYGWPVVTKGKDYIGSQITPFDDYKGMVLPNYNWTPSIAPSSMAFYSGDKFKSLHNRLLISSLKYRQLRTLLINGSSLDDEQVLFSNSEYRLRDITVSNEGDVFILSDSDPALIFKIVVID